MAVEVEQRLVRRGRPRAVNRFRHAFPDRPRALLPQICRWRRGACVGHGTHALPSLACLGAAGVAITGKLFGG